MGFYPQMAFLSRMLILFFWIEVLYIFSIHLLLYYLIVSLEYILKLEYLPDHLFPRVFYVKIVLGVIDGIVSPLSEIAKK